MWISLIMYHSYLTVKLSLKDKSFLLKCCFPSHDYEWSHWMSLNTKSLIYGKVVYVFIFWFFCANNPWFVKCLHCCYRKTTDCFYETTDCFPFDNIALNWIQFSMHCFWCRFLHQVVTSQNCSSHGSDFALKGSYIGHKGNILHIFLEN